MKTFMLLAFMFSEHITCGFICELYKVLESLKRCACWNLHVASFWTLAWFLLHDLTLLDLGIDSGQHLLTAF